MASFDKYMEKSQIQWRKENVTSNECGLWMGRKYPWIPPGDLWEEGLWSGIRAGSENSLPEYLESKGVQKHAGAHNLKSSWTQCANLYFPFRATSDSKALFASFLNRHVSVDVKSLDAIELEYAESGELSPARLLGEEGTRGANQTSPDLGLLINGCRGLILVENKLTEHSFYKCSAWRHKGSSRRGGNPDPKRCDHAADVVKNHAAQCHQTTWRRKYWEHLASVSDKRVFAGLCHCPASRSGYQLFRQQSLAEGIAQSEKYEIVVSAVAVDERNTELDDALRRSGIGGLRDWGRLFKGRAQFAVFTHQDWVRWVQGHDAEGIWSDWLDFVRGRYGLGA